MTLPGLGQLSTPDPYHELETKYLFGFTEGADIGAEGEKSIELETTSELGLRTGTYGILEQELEFEGVPTQNFGYELSAHGLGFSVSNVDGMADAHGFNFSGLSAELLSRRRAWSGFAVRIYGGRRAGMGPHRRWWTADFRSQHYLPRDRRH